LVTELGAGEREVLALGTEIPSSLLILDGYQLKAGQLVGWGF